MRGKVFDFADGLILPAILDLDGGVGEASAELGG